MDGTLVDSEPLWRAAEEATVKAYDSPWSPSLVPLLRGRSVEACAAVIAAHVGTRAVGAVGRRLLQEFKDRAGDVSATSSALATLQAAKSLRCDVAVVTNTAKPIAEELLRRCGLMRYVDVVRGPEPMLRPKPEPDLYLRACLDFGTKPANAVAVEDSRTGVVAAQRAGLYTIGIGVEGCEMTVPTLSSINITAVTACRTGMR